MTKFARSIGSKGSNKKLKLDATPWSQLKPKALNLDAVESLECEDDCKMTKKQKMNADADKKLGCITENGQRYKVSKKGEKKIWIDIPYEENEVMTLYNKFFIKKEAAKELDKFKETLRKQGLSEVDITSKMMTRERRAHRKLRVHLMFTQINAMKGKTTAEDGKNETLTKKTFKNNKKNKVKKSGGQKLKNDKKNIKINSADESDKKSSTPSKFNLPEHKFEENEFMTKFDDYWVARKNVSHLKNIREWKINRIIDAREDGSTDMELTEDESRLLHRQMKKEKRREHDFLCQQLRNGEFQSVCGDRLNSNMLEKKQQCNINNEVGNHTVEEGVNKEIRTKKKRKNKEDYNEGNMEQHNTFIDTNTGFKGRPKVVKFDGYSVTEDAAERLTFLKNELSSKDLSEKEISETIKLERRKDERSLKQIKKLICFNCRQPGHTVAQCRQTKTAEICFKCGSTEHMARKCFKDGAFNLAQCFHCQKTGHLARECPDNPNGIYPNGGCCRECNSVRHLARDCPTLKEKKEGVFTLKIMKAGDNPDEMDF